MTKVRTSQLAQTGAVTGQGLLWNGSDWLPAGVVASALLDAKGDLIVASADNTPARLGVGANNTALVADSTTALGVKWAIPTDTSKIPLAVIDAVGDLIVGSGPDTVTKLVAGANGTFLTPDSTVAGGLKWVAPPQQTAAQVPFTPTGTLEATNVQAALEELMVEGGSGGGGGGGGHVITDGTATFPQQPNLAFAGDGVVVSDDPSTNSTRVQITAVAQPTASAFLRQSVTYTSAVLAPNTDEVGLLALAAGYRLYQIETSRPARVRLYASVAHRDADRLRTRIATPPANSGLMLDYVTTQGALVATLSPLVDGYVSVGTNAALTVENMGTNGAVTLTLVYLRTE